MTIPKARKKIPFWAFATLSTLPLWAFMYVRALTPANETVAGPLGSGFVAAPPGDAARTYNNRGAIPKSSPLERRL